MIQDRLSYYFLCFLLFLSILSLGLCVFFGFRQSETAKRLLLAHDRAVAASLLEQGVSPETIVRAISSTEESEEAERLLEKAGRTQESDVYFFPLIRRRFARETAAAAVCTVLMAGSAMGAAVFFLRKREKIYLDAQEVLKRYAEGDFSRHLPKGRPGTLYRIFLDTEELAMALQAKQENEAGMKEFFKHMLSNISHQLKTPLAALRMYHEIISEEPEQPETVARFAEKSGQALTRIEQLIQELLKITRLDAGNIYFRTDVYTVQEVVCRAMEDFLVRAGLEGKELVFSGDPEEKVCCDLQWTGEALGNLIKNALDHTEEGGHIRISWERSPVMLRISVEDDGAGIAPEDLHHIFKRFYRSRNSSDSQGAGLGLSLAKAVIEGQGGALSVRSAPGEGTVFTASFLTKL